MIAFTKVTTQVTFINACNISVVRYQLNLRFKSSTICWPQEIMNNSDSEFQPNYSFRLYFSLKIMTMIATESPNFNPKTLTKLQLKILDQMSASSINQSFHLEFSKWVKVKSLVSETVTRADNDWAWVCVNQTTIWVTLPNLKTI